MAASAEQRIDVRVGPARLRTVVCGPAPGRVPLLLCNGIGASVELLEPLVDALGDHPTIRFDVPGVGESPDLAGPPPRISGYARLAIGILDALRVPTVDVLGLSWGGLLAQELARRQPGRVRRLVLVGTVAGGAAVPPSPRVLAAMMTPARYRSPEEFERLAAVLYRPELEADPHFLRHHERGRLLHQPTTRGYLRQVAATRGFASALWLHRLRQRTLVVQGTRDPIVPAVNARILSTLLPDAHLHLVEGGGHLVLMARAGEVGPVLRDFLQDGSRHGHAGRSPYDG